MHHTAYRVRALCSGRSTAKQYCSVQLRKRERERERRERARERTSNRENERENERASERARENAKERQPCSRTILSHVILAYLHIYISTYLYIYILQHTRILFHLTTVPISIYNSNKYEETTGWLQFELGCSIECHRSLLVNEPFHL